MKKISILLCLMIFLVGCTTNKVDLNDRDNILNITLNRNVKLYNRISKGYKYYLPKGMSLLDYKNYNEVLYSKQNKYYLYVDIISYHYKSLKDYIENPYSEYSKIINVDGNKKGYVQIDKYDNKYKVKYEYNYATIETIVDEKQINEALANMSYILSSIKYNDIIIDSIIGEDILNFKEEKYSIKKAKENENTFLDYVNIYDKYNGEEKQEDNDTIKKNDSDENKYE